MRSNDFIDASMLVLASFCRSSKFWNIGNLFECRPIALRADRGLFEFRPAALRADRGIVVVFERSSTPRVQLPGMRSLLGRGRKYFKAKFCVAWNRGTFLIRTASIVRFAVAI